MFQFHSAEVEDGLEAIYDGNQSAVGRHFVRKPKASSLETVIPQPVFGPSLLSPAATTAWRRLPPPSRMVLLLAGLGPGSKPPLPPASERLLRVSPGGLPETGREELFHRQGYSSRNPADDLNLGL